MALLDDIDTQRELVKRLVLAELLARPGHGPLALRGALGGCAVRAVHPAQPGPRPKAASREGQGEGGT